MCSSLYSTPVTSPLTSQTVSTAPGGGSRDVTSIPEWDAEEQMGGWISHVNLPVPNGDGGGESCRKRGG
ncbi:hypothetical protein TNCV_1903631 [Trichonephila clavipes]|nr:hypothetical protein TNCV_1903631 [Trichonephila clavipes]